MTPITIAFIIWLVGVALGALGSWYYMNERVGFWQDKFRIERGLKDRLLKQNLEALAHELEIYHDLSGMIKK